MTTSSIEYSTAAPATASKTCPRTNTAFSLVVSTRNRMPELSKFLRHLDKQTFHDFELLLVDQNSETSVPELLKPHSFLRHYFHSDERGASRGRNVVLQIAQGEILAVPDDDCWYSPDLLQSVIEWFDQPQSLCVDFGCRLGSLAGLLAPNDFTVKRSAAGKETQVSDRVGARRGAEAAFKSFNERAIRQWYRLLQRSAGFWNLDFS